MGIDQSIIIGKLCVQAYMDTPSLASAGHMLNDVMTSDLLFL